jgi:hypothetical protein
MHARGLFRECRENVYVSSQPCSDFLCLYKAPPTEGFLLACIGQPVAAAAREVISQAVQNRHSTTTVSAIFINGADEPRTPPAEVAVRPRERQSLADRFPLGSRTIACLVRQHNRVSFCADSNPASLASETGPLAGKVLTGGEQTFAIPATHVKTVARLAGGTSAVRGSAHHFCSIVEIIWQTEQLTTDVFSGSAHGLLLRVSLCLLRVTLWAPAFFRSIDRPFLMAFTSLDVSVLRNPRRTRPSISDLHISIAK